MLNILSLGAGVQSTCVYLRSCLGELDRLDCAIFADTGWEPKAVYDHLAWLRETIAPKYGIPIYVVSVGNIKQDALRSQVRGHAEDGSRGASMPYYTASPDGQRGMIKRQCTKEYKIEPIERRIKKLLGLSKRDRWPKEHAVRQWYGISADETRRMSWPIVTRKGIKRPVTWRSNVYPLCDQERFSDKSVKWLGLSPMSRRDCLLWFEKHGFPEPPRSACIGCPFHSDLEWQRLKQSGEFDEAVEFDATVRKCGGRRGDIFLHSDRVPLDQVRLTPENDYPLFPCEDGVCGV